MVALSSDIEDIKEKSKLNFRELLREWIFFQTRFVRKEKLAIPQLFTLRYIYYNHPENLSSIAEFMGVSKPTVTGITDTLEKKGYIKREMNKDDRRRIDIAVTDKSVELFRKFEAMTDFVIDEFIQSISDEDLDTLNSTMALLTAKLRNTSGGREETSQAVG